MSDPNFDGVIDPTASWASVPQASTEMLILGGEGGPLNAQAVALAQRTKFLKAGVDLLNSVDVGSNLTPATSWDSVPAAQAAGVVPLAVVANQQAQKLVNRTEWLKKHSLTDNDMVVMMSRYRTPGRQTLPSYFASVGINVYQDASGAFFTDFAESNYDETTLTSPTNYYISPTGSIGNTGLTAGSPKGSLTEMLAYIYANPPSGDIIINIADGTYRRGRSAAGDSNFLANKKYVIKATTKAILGSFENAGEVVWSAIGGGVSTAARSGVLEVFDFKVLDPSGVPTRYERKASLPECQAKTGSYYTDNTTIWCNPLPGSTLGTDVLTLLSASTPFWYLLANTKVFIKNLQFFYTQTTTSQTGSLRVLNMGLAGGTQFVGVNCKYVGNYGNGFTSYAVGLCINKGAVAAWCGGDGMNYHDDITNPISTAVEIDCTSYGHGLLYRPYGETKNNGSTAHDKMRMMRVNTNTWNTAGPVIADVNGLKSLNFGCHSHSSTLDNTVGGETRVASAWCFDDTGVSPGSEIWLIGCGGGGAKNFAISAQTGSPDVTVNIRDWRGGNAFSGNVNLAAY